MRGQSSLQCAVAVAVGGSYTLNNALLCGAGIEPTACTQQACSLTGRIYLYCQLLDSLSDTCTCEKGHLCCSRFRSCVTLDGWQHFFASVTLSQNENEKSSLLGGCGGAGHESQHLKGWADAGELPRYWGYWGYWGWPGFQREAHSNIVTNHTKREKRFVFFLIYRLFRIKHFNSIVHSTFTVCMFFCFLLLRFCVYPVLSSDLWSFLLPPPECWDYRCVPSRWLQSLNYFSLTLCVYKICTHIYREM